MNEVHMYLMGGVTLLLVGGLAFFMIKDIRKKKITFGEWLNENFLRQQVSWIIILLGLIILSEGLLAASIPLENEFVNPVARLIAHISIAFLSLVIAVGIPRTIIETVSSYISLVAEMVNTGGKKKSKNSAIIGKLVVLALINSAIMVITGYLAIYLPYWNVAIIANGLNELEVVEHAFMELLHNDAWMLEYYKAIGVVDPDAMYYNYRPFEEMSMTMAATWVLFMAHVILTFVDGLYATKESVEGDYEKQKKRSRVRENIHDTINKRGERESRRGRKPSEEDIEDTIESLKETISYLLEFTELFDTEKKLEDSVDTMEESFFDLKDKDAQNTLAAKTARLYNDVMKLEAEEDTMVESAARQRRKHLIKKIEELAKGSTRQGEGYGRPLPK